MPQVQRPWGGRECGVLGVEKSPVSGMWRVKQSSDGHGGGERRGLRDPVSL